MTQNNTKDDDENSPNLNDLINHFQTLYNNHEESLNHQITPTINETHYSTIQTKQDKSTNHVQ